MKGSSGDIKATRRECRRMVEHTERRVEDLRRLRDAAVGAEREELNGRLLICEKLLEGA